MNIGLVGAGEQTLQNLIPPLLQNDGVRIVAVCDLSRERGELAAARCGGAAVFHSITEMMNARLESTPLHAVVAGAYPAAHQELAERAIARDLPVFVEKPPTADLAQLQALVAAAREKKVVTGVGLNFRFAAPIQRLQQLISSPQFGEVAYIDVLHTANKPRNPLWGVASTMRAVLLAQTIHSLDLAIALGGKVIEHESRTVDARDGGLISELSLRFEGGALARVLSGNLFPDFTFFIRVVGRNGHAITVNNFWELEHRLAGRQGPDGKDNKRWKDLWHPSPLDSGHARAGYHGELTAFLDAVRKKERFACDFESLLPTYEVIEAACRPFETGQGSSR